MSDKHPTPYGSYKDLFRNRGLWPRPLKFPGVDAEGNLLGKGCRLPGWTTPDPELPAETLEKWDRQHAHYNIGLLMGTPLADGTFLGAFDIDDDRYVSLGRVLLNNPVSGRFGKKGAVFFARYTKETEKLVLKLNGKGIVDSLFDKTLCVVPPSTHPDTGRPYQWIGTPLYDVDFDKLPLIGA